MGVDRDALTERIQRLTAAMVATRLAQSSVLSAGFGIDSSTLPSAGRSISTTTGLATPRRRRRSSRTCSSAGSCRISAAG